jgi:hypothetical protein
LVSPAADGVTDELSATAELDRLPIEPDAPARAKWSDTGYKPQIGF